MIFIGILVSVVICLVNTSVVLASENSLKDRIQQELQKPDESKIKADNESRFDSVIRDEYERQKGRAYSIDTFINTARAVSLKYLPYLLLAILLLFLLGTTRESLKFLTKTALMLAFFSVIGYGLIFFARPIVDNIIEIVKSLKI